ncbi:OmcA/MtrC family decaheme c-type cytochrome [Halomonas denitrificans]|nr:OmcA/MtrC family decaheme c-type cytochrome [Halomonas denitrificans]
MKNINVLTGRRLVTALLPVMALAGCFSDGNDGSDGDDGAPGGIHIPIGEAQAVRAQIESVHIDESLKVSVDFFLHDERGVALSGLEALDAVHGLGMGIAKLSEVQRRDRPLPGHESALADATPMMEIELQPQWVSYLNRMVEPGTVQNPDSLSEGWDKHQSPQIQAGIESQCGLDCIDVVGNGLYRYTFTQPLDGYPVVAGIDTQYQPELVHRVYLELSLASGQAMNDKLVNTVYDFLPAESRAIEPDQGRELMAASQCQRCHGTDLDNGGLVMHGNKRFALDGCVMCHTTYSGDPETGATLDLGAMVHRLHQGDYLMIGWGGHAIDYSTLTYPGDMTQCRQCHVEQGEAATPQADAYFWPRQEACLSCHEGDANVEWDGTAVGLFHQRERYPKAWEMGCSGCHPDSSNPQGAGVFHNARAQLEHNLTTLYGATMQPGVLIPADGTLKVEIDFASLTQLPTEDVAIQRLWLTAAGHLEVGYHNDVANYQNRKVWDLASASDDILLSGAGPRLSVTISGINSADWGSQQSGSLWLKAQICADPATGMAIACDSPDKVVVELSAPPQAFAADSDALMVRTPKADEARCVACHDDQFMVRVADAHSRNNTPSSGGCGACHAPSVATSLTDGSCVACHTGDMVTYMNATLKHGTGPATVKGYRTLNNSLAYAELVHSLHVNTRTVSGYTGGEREPVDYTRAASDCRACHAPGQLTLAGLSGQPSLIVARSGADPAGRGEVVEISPITATCAACHLNLASWQNHAIAFGAVVNSDAINGPIYQNGSETCATCHGEGQSAGVDKLHRLK